MAQGRIGSKSAYPALRPDDGSVKSGALSPGGRLLQVEYARECPQSGSLAVALRFETGAVLGKALGSMPELGHRVPQVWPVTRSIAYVACGNLGDMFYLEDRIKARRARSSEAVAQCIRSALHEHAVRTDVRPLALQILLGSVDRGTPRIRGFDVTGAQFECNAWAFGMGDLRARNLLRTRWRDGLRRDDAERLVQAVYRRRPVEMHVVKRGA